MASAEDAPFTTLSQRIAALQKQQGGNGSNGGNGGNGDIRSNGNTGAPSKRPPPPLPPTAPRPPLPARGQTTNNPPLASYGSSVTKQANNQPIAAKNLLPPPSIDRDNPRRGSSPRLPPRAPPPLPARKSSVPVLPPRSFTAVEGRRTSDIPPSLTPTLHTSAPGTPSNVSSAAGRKLPPPLEDAKLPLLPPTRREREAAAARAKADETSRISAKTVPLLPSEFHPARTLQPMPPRPNGTPRLPARPSRGNLLEAPASMRSSPDTSPRLPAQEAGPALPLRCDALSRLGSAVDTMPQLSRKVPPPTAARSVLTMGFNHKHHEQPKQAPVSQPPRPSVVSELADGVIELTPSNFDSLVFAGRPALVDFYTTYCRYCVELEPVWKQLGQDFTSGNFLVGKCNVEAHPSYKDRFEIKGYPTILFFDGRTANTQKYPFARSYERLSKFIEQETGILASRPPQVPPPINTSSKPSHALIQAIQTPSTTCLICRDYSGPDMIAAQNPRDLLPRSPDPLTHLATVLCGPFPSATDKARAIFTWLHQNIAYDVASFFSNSVRHVTPLDTISTGVAVCGGYAGLFSAIALKAGLEAVTVTGHGKGFGFTALQPGQPVPVCDPSGHAWNAVKIDDGEWKLLDPCWGAGNVSGQSYNKRFAAGWFTMSNEEFGFRHFPQDQRYFFRDQGSIPSWQEYYLGSAGEEPVTVMGAVDEHGIREYSFSPSAKRISVQSSSPVRFQFSRLCEHWDHERNGSGKPYCMVLKIGGVDGRKDDFVPFQRDEDWWWIDVAARDLGAPGMKISAFAVTTVDGRDARHLDRPGYLAKKGRAAMGFAGVAEWVCTA